MIANGIAPNIHTFNAALNVATTIKTNTKALNFTRNILADITKFKLKPSLTTYYYLLQILSRFGNSYFFISQRFYVLFKYSRVYSLKQVIRHTVIL